MDLARGRILRVPEARMTLEDLTAEEIAQLRHKAAAWVKRIPPGRPRYARKHVGGPLDGMITWTADSSTPMYTGICTVRSDGPAQFLYKHSHDRVWLFHEIDRPGSRAGTD